jgi:hypothetical protein
MPGRMNREEPFCLFGFIAVASCRKRGVPRRSDKSGDNIRVFVKQSCARADAETRSYLLKTRKIDDVHKNVVTQARGRMTKVQREICN